MDVGCLQCSLPSIQTVVRVNAKDIDRQFLSTTFEINEIRLVNYGKHDERGCDTADSWVVDNVLDDIEEYKDVPSFCSQQNVFEMFQDWHRQNLTDEIVTHNCLLIGGRGSGKSYTLLGDNTHMNQGLIPRFIESVFESSPGSAVQLSVYMCHDDHITDLLAPPHRIPYDSNVTYSSTVGAVVIPLQTCVCDTSVDALHTLHLAVLACSVLAINTDDPFNSGHLIISIQVHSPSPACLYTVNFIETSSTLFLPAVLTANDRLGTGIGLDTANAFVQCGLYGNIQTTVGVNSGGGGANKSKKNDRNRGPIVRTEHELSFLTYMLQESLLLTSPPVPSPLTLTAATTQLSTVDSNHQGIESEECAYIPPPSYATLLIGCVRGDETSVYEDRYTLELLQAISDMFQTAHQVPISGAIGGSAEGVEGDNGVEILTPKQKLQRQSDEAKVQFQHMTRRDHSVQSALAGLRLEISAVESDLQYLSTNSSSQGVSSRSSLSNGHHGERQSVLLSGGVGVGGDSSERGNERIYLERKLFTLRRLKQFVEKPLSLIHRNQPLSAPPSVPALIQGWLKNRGVLGITVDEDEREAEVDLFQVVSESTEDVDKKQKMTKKSGKNVVDREESPLPWTASHHKVPNDPYLTPITGLDFPRYYLQMSIPGGHMAICRAPLTDDLVEMGGQDHAKMSLPNLKHCKLFRLDGSRIRDQHCVFFRLGTSVKVRPLFDEDGQPAFVQVNGRSIFEETVLHNNDTLRIGLHCVFVLTIPDEPPLIDLGPRPSSGIGASALGDELMLQDMTYEGGGEGSRGYSADDALRALPSIISATTDDLQSMRWEYCSAAAMQYDFLKTLVKVDSQVRHNKHMQVERELVEIAKKSELTDIMRLEAYEPYIDDLHMMCLSMSKPHKAVLCEALLGVANVNMWSSAMRRHVRFMLHLEPVVMEGRDRNGPHASVHSKRERSGLGGGGSEESSDGTLCREYRGLERGIIINGCRYMVNIRAEILDDGNCTGRGDSWIWSITTFIRRYCMMEAMYKTFVTTCESDLEVLDELMPMSADPFFDPSQPELIGVASLHLDSLFYLCDIRDHLPIVTFKGNKGGFLKMTARTWIDEVETIPTYICVDKESKLTDFSGQKCIIRFYFEALHDITPALSSDVQVAFTFFCHSGQYRTTRHRAVNVMEGDKHPFLNSTVVVEQKITPDFIRYIQKKCLELEIWGSRITNRQFEDTDHSKFVLVAQRVGDAAMMERVRNYIKTVLAREGKTQGPATDAVNEGCGDGADEDEITVAGSKGGTVEDDVEALKLKLKEMAIMLDKAEKNLKRTTRTSVAFRDEISKTNAKISQSTKKAELQLKEKDSEIETLRRQLEHLQEKERVLTERERVEAAKKRSTVCIIS